MEDGWLLAQLLESHLDRHTSDRQRGIGEALERFDEIRSPYYHRIYDVLDAKPEGGKVDYSAWSPTPGGPLDWIYFHDIEEEWKRVQAKDKYVARMPRENTL